MVQEEVAKGMSIIDVLSELANIGAGNASARLEKKLKERTTSAPYGQSTSITPQLIEYCHLSNIDLRFPKTTHCAFFSVLRIEGTNAMITALFSMESSLFISGLLCGKEKHYEVLLEEDERVLKEVASAVIDSYVESTATFLNIPIIHTETKKAYLSASAIADFVKDSIGPKADVALLFKTDLSVKGTSYKGDLKIMLSLTDIEPITHAIRANFGIEVEGGDADKKTTTPFNIQGGGRVTSIAELRSALPTMHDFSFHHHVTPFRNDFAAWVYDVFHEKDLALRMGAEKSREGLMRIMDEFLRQQPIKMTR